MTESNICTRKHLNANFDIDMTVAICLTLHTDKLIFYR